MEQALRVTVFGPSGYTGLELLRVLSQHRKVEVVQAVSGSFAGKRLGEAIPHLMGTPLSEVPILGEPEEDFDLAFLCLPHEASLEEVPKLLSAGKRVIDLSGAYRLKDPSDYEAYYGFSHTYPELLKEAVYGLPELFREKVKGAKLLANPGCYPTATLLGLFPLAEEGLLPDKVTVHALSGVSGAGRTPKQHFHFPEMESNFFAYSVENHRHVPEMEGILKEVSGREVRIRFTPTVVPAPRGILVTLYVETDPFDIRELFVETYREEPFIKVVDSPPMVRWVLGTNFCLIYPFYDRRTKTAVVISVIDNLGKGASGQAVQNMNLMVGFEETEGIPVAPPFP